MKVEQSQYGQILFLGRDDFVEEEYYQHFSLIGIGIVPKIHAANLRSCFAEPELVGDDKHVIFVLSDFWSKISAIARKVIMDHEFGHSASGQMDSPEMQNAGGVVVNLDWEVEADNFSVKQNGKETTLQGLLEACAFLNKNPIYVVNEIDLFENDVIVERLKRLGWDGVKPGEAKATEPLAEAA